MSLLDVRGLTMRFGGLTAVSKVDVSVETGQIFSIIGPNGAGKTTVFNAITGLYEPTEGTVRFDGRDPRRPFRAGVVIGMVLIGLFAGIGLALLSTNVDSLWRAVVVLNYPDSSEPFPLRRGWKDLRTFLRAGVMAEREQNPLADIEVKAKGGSYAVRSTSTKFVFETHKTQAAALRRKKILEGMVNLAGSARTAIRGDGRWLVGTPSRHYVGMYESEEIARRQVQDLHDLPRAVVVESEGKYLLQFERRTLAIFSNHIEAGKHQKDMAYAAEAAVEKGEGRWIVLATDRKTVLDVFDSREQAKAKLSELAVAAGKLKWRLVTRSSAEAFGIAGTPEKADEYTRGLEEAMDAGVPPILEEREGKFQLRSPSGIPLLEPFDAREDAEERARFIVSVGRARARDRVLLWVFLVVGVALGAGGAFVYWRRARGTPDVISLGGMARTFQNIRLFHNMTVLENVLVAMDRSFRAGILRMMLRTPGTRTQERAAGGRGMEILKFVGLESRAHSLAKNLPYGGQRRLEIARALATEPRLLLLDEPAAGMNPAETVDLMELIRRIRDRGTTVLLIEHHMSLVMGISDRIAVLDHGVKIAEGTPQEVKGDPKVIEAYLGKEEVS